MHKIMIVVALCCLCVLSQACKNDTITSLGESNSRSVSFDLRALKSINAQGSAIRALTVADSLFVAVNPENADSEFIERQLTAKDSIVSFPVTVKKGKVDFSAEIRSNNGTVLYAGKRTVELSKDNFDVNIPLEPQDAIMVVAPDSLIVEAEIPAVLLVENRGVKPLDWKIERVNSIDGSCQRNCLFFLPDTVGRVSPGKMTSVFVRAGRAAFEEGFGVRINSNVGSVETYIERDIQRIPDLIVTGLRATGQAIINASEQVEVPIEVVIKNQGTAPADIFKISAEYSSPPRRFAVAFRVPGQNNGFYPFTSEPLAADSSVTFAGNIVFGSFVRNVTVTLRIYADSCSGDEFMPAHCRILESDEDNNASIEITLQIP